MRRLQLLTTLAFAASLGCRPEPLGAARDAAPAGETALEEVARIHGGAGPWAVLGYRMGVFALTRLGLAKQAFDLEVVHASPAEVQYSCIADGAAAATGASLGKLNLRLEVATPERVRTIFRHKPTGREVVLEPTDGFRKRFAGVPREGLADAGREVLSLPDGDLFRVIPASPQ